MQIQSKVHDLLLGIAPRGIGLDLGEAVAEEPDAVDEQAVGGALDLKVAEKGVGAEEGDDLVEDVVALRVRVGGLGGGEGRAWDGQGVGRAADLCAQGQERKVANQPGLGLRVEDGIVGLCEDDDVSTCALGVTTRDGACSPINRDDCFESCARIKDCLPAL